MIYRAIGIMSGSSLDGLDIVFAEFQEQAGQWSYTIRESACYQYDEAWKERLRDAVALPAAGYLLLHTAYGRYIGEKINQFIEEKSLHYQVGLISSHGHTTFHMPARGMTAQLGDGAAIAAVTGLPVVTDLRALDVALGGQGAPIVPVGEKRLLAGYDYFLNIGGIANISVNADPYTAFDICPANRVLNMLAREAGKEYDEGGKLAASGQPDSALLEKLNQLDYYRQPPPKSLANDFGTETVYPLIRSAGLTTADALRTCCEHISFQTAAAIKTFCHSAPGISNARLLCTGGGARNTFLVRLLAQKLNEPGIEFVVPEPELIDYKEALIMAFIGVLRWRQEYNVLASVTGASRNSIGGALWTGQDA